MIDPADVLSYLRTHSIPATLAAARVVLAQGADGSTRGVSAWGVDAEIGAVRQRVAGPADDPDGGLWTATYGGAPLGGTDAAPVLLEAAWALVRAAALADGYVWGTTAG